MFQMKTVSGKQTWQKYANIVGRRLGHCLLLSHAHCLTDLSTISILKERKANSVLWNFTSYEKHEIINIWCISETDHYMETNTYTLFNSDNSTAKTTETRFICVYVLFFFERYYIMVQTGPASFQMQIVRSSQHIFLVEFLQIREYMTIT